MLLGLSINCSKLRFLVGIQKGTFTTEVCFKGGMDFRQKRDYRALECIGKTQSGEGRTFKS